MDDCQAVAALYPTSQPLQYKFPDLDIPAISLTSDIYAW
jgi:hypothetical protein